MAEPVIDIEVVYAAIDRQQLLALTVPAGTTLRAAVLASGIGQAFPEVDLADCPLGIFGRQVMDPQVRVVQAGDRIEIYRPLLADPKEIRRQRAAKAAEAKRLSEL
ncbi:RnfH family protein [Pseudomonas psychrophila]|uniref:RnfH family protein n=1 Tax=Pseudomonas psychrophila TaxID=122355 RepID=UPI0002FC3BE2|nr:RnfH family protein [Pseudomonas psychrophila]